MAVGISTTPWAAPLAYANHLLVNNFTQDTVLVLVPEGESFDVAIGQLFQFPNTEVISYVTVQVFLVGGLTFADGSQAYVTPSPASALNARITVKSNGGVTIRVTALGQNGVSVNPLFDEALKNIAVSFVKSGDGLRPTVPVLATSTTFR